MSIEHSKFRFEMLHETRTGSFSCSKAFSHNLLYRNMLRVNKFTCFNVPDLIFGTGAEEAATDGGAINLFCFWPHRAQTLIINNVEFHDSRLLTHHNGCQMTTTKC